MANGSFSRRRERTIERPAPKGGPQAERAELPKQRVDYAVRLITGPRPGPVTLNVSGVR